MHQLAKALEPKATAPIRVRAVGFEWQDIPVAQTSRFYLHDDPAEAGSRRRPQPLSSNLRRAVDMNTKPITADTMPSPPSKFQGGVSPPKDRDRSPPGRRFADRDRSPGRKQGGDGASANSKTLDQLRREKEAVDRSFSLRGRVRTVGNYRSGESLPAAATAATQSPRPSVRLPPIVDSPFLTMKGPEMSDFGALASEAGISSLSFFG